MEDGDIFGLLDFGLDFGCVGDVAGCTWCA